jgi:hypothetical protein
MICLVTFHEVLLHNFYPNVRGSIISGGVEEFRNLTTAKETQLITDIKQELAKLTEPGES